MFYEQEAEDKLRERDKADWYSAQQSFWTYMLWHEVRHIFAANRPRPQMVLEDFLISFRGRREEKIEKELSETEKVLKCEMSKAAWLGAVGLGGGSK